MRSHAVGHGLDERGALAGVGPGQGEAGRSQDGQHVVAVDLDPGDAVALAALGDRGVGLEAYRLGDGPLVVLAEEDDRDRRKLAAKPSASATSPSLLAPSPK